MRKIIEAALSKAEDAEVYSVKMEKYPVKFSGNKLKSIKSQLFKSVSLRVNHKGRLGFSSDTSVQDPKDLVNRAIESAKLGPPCSFEFCKNDLVTPVDIFDPRTVSFDMEEAVEMGQKMLDQILKYHPETINDINITRYFIEVSYLSGDVEKIYYKTLVTRGISSMQVTDDGFIYIDAEDASCRLPEDTLSPVRKIIEKIPLTKKSYEMVSRPTTVIFHPKASYYIVDSLKAGLSGKNLVSETSPLLNKYNRQILDQRFTLADDPTIALGAESEGFDGEGLPRHRQVLFDRGVLVNYLLDQDSAASLNMEPNACAQRPASGGPPTPGATNLVIDGGDVTYKDMVEGISDGLIVEEVIGGGQSNVVGGEFSLNVSLGFKIENGKIAGRVKNTMIAGNVYDILKNHLTALSVERETHNSIKSPYIMFKDLSVSGKG